MKKIIYILLALLPLTFLGSCVDSAEEQARQTKALRDSLRREDSASFKVGVLPTVESLPVVVAKRLRLFDTLGVDVHLRYYHALCECRKALMDSITEAAVIDSTLFRQLQGEKVDACAHTHAHPVVSLVGTPVRSAGYSLVASQKSRITRVSQMADKMIAADSHGATYSIAHQVLDSVPQKQHAFIVTVEDIAVRYDMVINNSLDAAVLPEPQASNAIKAGARVVPLATYRTPSLIAVRSKSLQQPNRRKQYDTFLKAIDMARDSISRYGVSHYVHLLKW